MEKLDKHLWRIHGRVTVLKTKIDLQTGKKTRIIKIIKDKKSK